MGSSMPSQAAVLFRKNRILYVSCVFARLCREIMPPTLSQTSLLTSLQFLLVIHYPSPLSSLTFSPHKQFRNKKVLCGEIFTTVIYLAVLAFLSTTVEVTINPAQPMTWMENIYGNQFGAPSEYAFNSFFGCLPFASTAEKNCTDGSWEPGNLGFSDSER